MSIKEPKSTFDREPQSQTQSSRPASIFSAQSIDTLVTDQRYRGFPSEQAYLDALKEWAQSKLYYENDEQLQGFYGTKTVDDILHKQGTTRGAKKSVRDQRRATVAPQLPTLDEHNGSNTNLSRENSAAASAEATETPPEGKSSRLKRVFTRRKSAV
ncbi:hypothetical protein Z517_00662 [Fonsecaea pedrosoi CBS 271.37]|uniref:Uncharacterized protein n=1 Tax=Fonsecaea pedrosoi CBS 271.37 TaxID=1442368 RepID=A0A0D2FF50_9EURO|nr:uncharacterized protein Z517_00662 [Fonsecaea pedrosoi CBS 271.37]KIW85272.1 hypothetical protein Z517_00662 [Fonsecaea pedrosoi CBS 271.37]